MRFVFFLVLYQNQRIKMMLQHIPINSNEEKYRSAQELGFKQQE
jgi:hypothetical protein